MGRILGLVLLLTSTSCTSFLAATPFGERTELSEDRVNVWPIFYTSGGITSALWPIFEIGPDRFALRPIYQKDSDSIDIVWPIFHKEEDGDGWLFPLAYWSGDGERVGSPILLSGIDSTSDPSTLYSPLWVRDNDYVAIPVLLTAWSTSDEDDESDRGFFANPLWYRSRHAEGSVSGVPLLLSWHRSSPDGYRTDLLLSLFSQSDSPDRFRSRLLPLYDFESETDGAKTFSLIEIPFAPDYTPLSGEGLGVSLVSVRSDDDEFSHSVFPFYRSIDRPGLESLQIALLYGRARSVEGSYDWLLPFFWSQDTPERKSTVIPLALSGALEDRDPETGETLAESTHLLLSMIAWGTEGEASFHRAYPFYGYETDPSTESKSLELPILFARFAEAPDYRDVQWPLAIYRYTENEYLDRGRIGYLYDWWTSPGGSGSGFFPLYRSEHREYEITVEGEPSVQVEKSRFELALKLYEYEREVRDGSLSRTDRVLWKVWQHDYDGDRRSIDAFPFYSYESSEESDRTEWSWLWRVLHYERDGDDADFSFCFIPIF